MAFCRDCGASINDAATFCEVCGRPQRLVPSATKAQSQEAETAFGTDSTGAQKASLDVAGGVITIFGGCLLVLSAFVPWMTARVGLAVLNRNAFQLGNNLSFSVDGLVLTLLGLVAILIGITRCARVAMPSFLQRSPIVVGVGAVIVPLASVGSISSLVRQVSSSSALASASVGFGVWLAVFAALVTAAGGIVLHTQAAASDPLGALAEDPDGSPPVRTGDEEPQVVAEEGLTNAPAVPPETPRHADQRDATPEAWARAADPLEQTTPVPRHPPSEHLGT